MQIAAVEPEVLLLRRFPHVPLFALPRTGSLVVSIQAPALRPPCRRFPDRDEVGDPAVHVEPQPVAAHDAEVSLAVRVPSFEYDAGLADPVPLVRQRV